MAHNLKHFSVGKLLLALILISGLATFLDTWCYVLYSQPSGLVGLLNPVRIARYILSPIGLSLRIIMVSPHLLIGAILWYAHRRSLKS